MNFRYPVFLDVAGRKCVVTGEGFEIPAKVHTLVTRGAEVVYVNPTAEESIANLARAGKLTWVQHAFQPADLDGALLVITDLDDNSVVYRAAEQRNVLCNAADDPDFCRFSFGSVVSRGDLTVAVSTNGIAPGLAVRLRERFEREFGDEYEQFLSMLGDIRGEITQSIEGFERRRALWYRIIDSDVLLLIRRGDPDGARSLIRDLISEAKASPAAVE